MALPIIAFMQRPIDVDLPHRLGKDEAKRRLGDNVGKLRDHIPGGASHVESRWDADTLHLSIGAMGQTVDAEVEVRDSTVHCRVMLPGMLSLLAGPIEAMLKAKGNDLLLEDKRD